MTQPGLPDPGPPRPGPGPRPPVVPQPAAGLQAPLVDEPVPRSSAADEPGLVERLGGLPVAEHATVLEAEHDRLQRRLATIDQL